MPLKPGIHHIEPNIAVHVFEAAEAGPTALIQAGIHGDEVAGVHALQEWLEEGVSISRGRLLVIPVMNPGAYRARQRCAVGGLDLNRCFPGDASHGAREQRLAHRFMSLVEDEKPALMATLHESWKRYHPQAPVSFGQTIVYGVDPMPPIVQSVVDAMNAGLDNPYEVWAPHHFPVSTSSTEVIVDRVGCIGLCIETWMGFEEARRVEMQRRVVSLLLKELGVTDA